MKIIFEKWLDDNSIPQAAMELFKESVVCYKVSAYRSSFLMSYIAFQNILKERIINSPYIPTDMESKWNEICNKLGDEDTWDAEVSRCVKRNSPNRIFLISDSIVKEYDALRVLRNKCAHGKRGHIDYFHVELLWNFISENFYKFVVNGGKSGLMQIIERHYDRTETPLGTDTTYIIENIKSGIQDNELDELIQDFYQFCEQENSSTSVFSDRNRMLDLWDKLVNESDSRIRDAVIRFVMGKVPEKLLQFVARYPATAEEFLDNHSFTRKLWTGFVNECDRNEVGKWLILEKVILNNMVPETEDEEFQKILFKSVGWFFPEEKVELLKKTQYFQELRRLLFDSSQYGVSNGINFANRHAYLFVHYIRIMGLDEKAVSCINCIFSFATYGSFYDGIRTLFKDNQELIDTYKRICSEKGIEDYSEKVLSTE